jgi:hypothetical protein
MFSSIIAVAALASALGGPAHFTATMHDVNVPDTTSISGPGTTDSPGGPVWAHDSLERVVKVNGANGSYSIVINSHGTYTANADPRTGDFLTASGPVDGEVTYQVNSATAPDKGLLPKQGIDVHSGDILADLFPGGYSVTGSSYHFHYVIGGQGYSQDG